MMLQEVVKEKFDIPSGKFFATKVYLCDGKKVKTFDVNGNIPLIIVDVLLVLKHVGF